MNMKKTLIATLAFATLVASPAFAQSNGQRTRHVARAIENTNMAVPGDLVLNGTQNPNVVTFANRVVGQDPDINIRTQLLRDPFPIGD